MSYNAANDFLALLRQTSDGARVESMPGLDYVIAALSRAGMVDVWINPTVPPSVNVQRTVWLKTSSTSWAVEGTVLLYNAATGNFEAATSALWSALLTGTGNNAPAYVFQSVVNSVSTVFVGTTLVAVQRNAPINTTLNLPSVAAQQTQDISITDWSTNVANHQITLVPSGAETIMQQTQWTLFSSAVQQNSCTLRPSVDLNGWVIAP